MNTEQQRRKPKLRPTVLFGVRQLAKGPSGNKVYILLLAPRPAGKARATSIPGAVCKERATPPAGGSPEGRGGGRASALLPLLDDAHRHRLRRDASHLPARRSRQNAHLIS